MATKTVIKSNDTKNSGWGTLYKKKHTTKTGTVTQLKTELCMLHDNYKEALLGGV